MRPHSRRPALALAFALSLAPWFRAPGPVAAQSWPGTVALWTVEQSGPLVQPAQRGAMSLVAEGGALWLTTETTVTRGADGLWEQPQEPPSAGGLFALAPRGEDAWAFGFEGATWRRAAGHWSRLASPTTADLYAATTRGADEVWAVGFDYGAEQGTLLKVSGGSLSATTRPWLGRIQLYSLARAPDGELWAGGCSYTDEPFLMRDAGLGDWQPVSAPLAVGCVFHLSFAANGFGLAAAGRDVLAWDGERWRALGQAPPEGLQWLRVAALPPAAGPAGQDPRAGRGWAVPAVATWRGYEEGGTPWYYDGAGWGPVAIDYGPYAAIFEAGAASPATRPFVALAADGRDGWTVSLGQEAGAEGSVLTGLVRLEGRGGRLWHPPLAARAARDVADAGEGWTWVAGLGAMPLLGHGPEGWQPGVSAGAGPRLEFQLVDLAGPAAGWALARESETPFAGFQLWRWDGARWAPQAGPAGEEPRRVRALPDGGAWALMASGRLFAWSAGAWTPVPDAPPIEVPVASDVLPAARPFTPFDVAVEDGALLACVATVAGVYRYADGRFQLLAAAGAGPRYVDLQLTGPHQGWALPADGQEAALAAGQVARLADCLPRPLRLDDSTRPLRLGPFQIMAAADADTVFLYRGAGGPRAGPQLVGYRHGTGLIFERGAAADWWCPTLGLAALPAPGGQGADLWLAGGPWFGTGPAACGPPPTEDGQTIQPWPGSVSRLRVHAVAGRAWLPWLARGANPSVSGARPR